MTKNFSEYYHSKHAKRITEGELWYLMKNVRENANNNVVMYGVTDCESTEYYSHKLTNILI